MELTITNLSLRIFCVTLNRQSINLPLHHVTRENRAPFYNIMEYLGSMICMYRSRNIFQIILNCYISQFLIIIISSYYSSTIKNAQ